MNSSLQSGKTDPHHPVRQEGRPVEYPAVLIACGIHRRDATLDEGRLGT